MSEPAVTVEPMDHESATETEVETGMGPGPAADGEAGGGEQRQTILEMRQVAGLTAGSVMGLHRGSFQFRESDKDVGFSLIVSGADNIAVIAGSAATIVDEIPVDEPTPLGSSVLNVGSACFTVRPPRPEPSPEIRLVELLEARTPPKAIVVPEFLAEHPEIEQTSSSRFGALFSRSTDDSEPPLDGQSWRFLESIRDARSAVAERYRKIHPDPEELMSRLDRMDPGLWTRAADHSQFARFPIAYSTIPWQPRFDDPSRIPSPLHRPIREMSCLPWVPITANLLQGPLGIVGSRAAVLACARQAVLSLACMTSPLHIEFSIVTAQGLVEDWDWTSSLPNSLFPSYGSETYCVAVADGMTHFDGAGLDHQAVEDNEMGLIVLGESADQLPDDCATILELTDDGQCHVTNHLGEQIFGTPIGMAAGFAATMATLVRAAVGDEPTDGSEPGDVMEPNDTAEPAHGADDEPADRQDTAEGDSAERHDTAESDSAERHDTAESDSAERHDTAEGDGGPPGNDDLPALLDELLGENADDGDTDTDDGNPGDDHQPDREDRATRSGTET